MAPKYKVGQEVKQLVVPVQGTITERIVDGDDDCYKVEWNDGEDTHSRFFKEEEIEAV